MSANDCGCDACVELPYGERRVARYATQEERRARQPDEQARAEVEAALNAPRPLVAIAQELDAELTTLEYNIEQSNRERVALQGQLTSVLRDRELLQQRHDWYKAAAAEAYEREKARAEKAEKALEETEQLYGLSIRRIFELYDVRDDLAHEIDYLLEKMDFLEEALQRYASHAWNDLKRELWKIVRR